MSTSYNQIAGQSIERLAALSDGIFAVAMTLLVLDLHTPARETVHTEHDLWHALVAMSPQLITYLLSFVTLGIFWTGQQTQLHHVARGDRHLTWIHIAFLFAVSMMPFSTRLLAEFISYRTALLAYWGNVLLLGSVLHAGWRSLRPILNFRAGSKASKADLNFRVAHASGFKRGSFGGTFLPAATRPFRIAERELNSEIPPEE